MDRPVAATWLFAALWVCAAVHARPRTSAHAEDVAKPRPNAQRTLLGLSPAARAAPAGRTSMNSSSLTPAEPPAARILDCAKGFRLVQYGAERTGSTYQWYLLCTIARLCRVRGFDVAPQCNPDEPKSRTTVIKHHKLPASNPRLYWSTRTGKNRPRNVIVMQVMDDLLRHGEAQIYQEYMPHFGLTLKEADMVADHMRHWSLLRKCCGTQSSKYQRARLHGEAVVIKNRLLDPGCDMYNLTSIEVHFATSAIAKLFPKSLYVAMGNSGDGNFEVGFCARTNAFVAAGHDFNGQAWKPGRAVYIDQLVDGKVRD